MACGINMKLPNELRSYLELLLCRSDNSRIKCCPPSPADMDTESLQIP